MRVRLKRKRLIDELARSRLSQNHWALRLKLDKGHLSQLVNGKRKYPSASTRRKLLDGLGLGFEDLFEIEEKSPKSQVKKPPRKGEPFRSFTPQRRGRPPYSFDNQPGKENMFKGISEDFRFGLRMLFKNPGFSAVIVLVLALGIGANTAIYSVVKQVVLEPLPYSDPQRLVVVWENDRHRGTEREGASIPDFLDWRERSRFFQQLAATHTVNRTLTEHGEPRRLVVSRVSPGYFSMLGVEAIAGRTFRPDEETPGKDKTVVLLWSTWQDVFGADPEIVGSSIVLDGEAHEVVGIVPAEARIPNDTSETWVPLAPGSNDLIRGRHSALVLGRYRRDATLSQVQEEMTAIMAALEKEYPEDNGARGAFVSPLHDEVVQGVKPALMLLLVAVGCVLLIACVNVANLLLSKAAAREGELAVRTALGAGRRRIVRQLMTENLLLMAAGAAAGLILAVAGVRILLALAPAGIPRLDSVQLDASVLGFALLVSLLTWLIFGLVPALRTSTPDLHLSLKEGGRSATLGLAGRRSRQTLVVAEVALAVVLVVCAGLLVRSFWHLSQVDPGLDPSRVLSFSFDLPPTKYPFPDRWPVHHWPQAMGIYERVLQDVGRIPGVESLAVGISNPLGGGWTTRVAVVGQPIPPEDQRDEAYFRPVGEGYFRTLGVPLKGGRVFTAQDDAHHPLTVIVNEAFTRKYFPEGEAIGEQITIYGAPRLIVGVVGDVRFRGLTQSSYPAMYLPFRQNPFGNMNLIYKAKGDPSRLLSTVQAALWGIEKDLAIYNVTELQSFLHGSLRQQRFTLTLLICFAMTALILSAVGIYGVVSFLAGQRIREIGIRMALGARRRQVFQQVLGLGMTMVIVGVVLGLIGALLSTGLLSSLLVGVSTRDPWTFAIVAVLLAGVAVLACFLPARRASSLDPMTALRHE